MHPFAWILTCGAGSYKQLFGRAYTQQSVQQNTKSKLTTGRFKPIELDLTCSGLLF